MSAKSVMSFREFFILTAFSFIFSTQGFSQEKRFTNLNSNFSTTDNLNGRFSSHKLLTTWIESIMDLGLKKNFEGTNTNGFALSLTTVRFRQRLNVFEQTFFSQAAAQQVLFPSIRFYDCNQFFCKAEQVVGTFLPNAHFTANFRFLKLNNPSEIATLTIPKELFKDTQRFPKYIVLQLATDWSQYFHRASSISVFEPDPTEGWLQISSYQTISLTRVGSVGRATLKSALEDQIQSFLIAFVKL
jgi:hypothetical protein